jgi:hypothetical protein
MKNISDMLGHNRASEADNVTEARTDFMNIRKIPPSESLTEKLLHAAEYERGITDHLIRGLVERLPKPDTVWPLEDRVKWIRTATGVFDLVYKSDDQERREIMITIGKQDAVKVP